MPLDVTPKAHFSDFLDSAIRKSGLLNMGYESDNSDKYFVPLK
jgi:hypothetical protein